MGTNETPSSAPESKPPRMRSPNYPSISLKESVAKTALLFKEARTHKISLAKAAEVWDATPTSSSFMKAVGALRSFGLIEVEGSGVQRRIGVTEAGERIVGDAPDKAARIQEAALRPVIYREVVKKFSKNGELPNDSVLRDQIRWDPTLGFNPKYIEAFISSLRETLDFAKPDLSVKLDDVEGGDTEDTAPMPDRSRAHKSKPVVQHKAEGAIPVAPLGVLGKAGPIMTISNVYELPNARLSIQLDQLDANVPLTSEDIEFAEYYLGGFQKVIDAKLRRLSPSPRPEVDED